MSFFIARKTKNFASRKRRRKIDKGGGGGGAIYLVYVIAHIRLGGLVRTMAGNVLDAEAHEGPLHCLYRTISELVNTIFSTLRPF